MNKKQISGRFTDKIIFIFTPGEVADIEDEIRQEEIFLKAQKISNRKNRELFLKEEFPILKELELEIPEEFKIRFDSEIPTGRGADWIAVAAEIYTSVTQITEDIATWATIALLIKKIRKSIMKKREVKPVLSIGALKFIAYDFLQNDFINKKALRFSGIEDVRFLKEEGFDIFDLYLAAFEDDTNYYYVFISARCDILSKGKFKIEDIYR